jgi:hypothetical protein
MERKNFSTRKEIGMEAAALVENSRTVDELESYFKAYTDLPREVVLKHDLLPIGLPRWRIAASLHRRA